MFDITVNGEPHTVPDVTTTQTLLELLQVGQRAVAVEINGSLVPRQQHATHAVQNGDRVEVVTLVGGG